MFNSKKGNWFIRVTALLTACVIVLGMSGIKSLAETSGSDNLTVIEDQGGSGSGNTLEDEGNSNKGSNEAGNGGSLEQGSSKANVATSGSSETVDDTNGAGNGDSANESGSDASNGSSDASTEGSSDAATAGSSDAATAATSDKPRVLGAKRLKDQTSPTISEAKIIFAEGATAGGDYRWEESVGLRTRNAVTISVNVIDPDPNQNNETGKESDSNTVEPVSGIKSVKITYNILNSNGSSDSITKEMSGNENGTYTFTFPESTGVYQIVSITAEDNTGNTTKYTADNNSTSEYNENNIFVNISVEEDKYVSDSEEEKVVNFVTDPTRILTVGNYKSSGKAEDPWFSLSDTENATVTLSVFLTAYCTYYGNYEVSLVPLDANGNEVAEDAIEGTIDASSYWWGFVTDYTITFTLPNDADQYRVYKLSSEGSNRFNRLITQTNNKGLIYVKIDSTRPVARDIEVTYDEDGDGGVSGTYNFGEGEERIIYSQNSLTLNINTSNSYDPAINEGNYTDENDKISASGLCKLTYVIYDDEYTDGSNTREVEIEDLETDESGNIRIELPNVSQGQGPVYIGNVKLIDAAGNETLVYDGKIEPVSYVIDNVQPVISFTELEGESLTGSYPTDLASTTYFFNHDVTGKLSVEERYIKEVTLSEKSGYMKANLSDVENPSTELGAVTEYTFSSSGDGEYFFAANAVDKSGNQAESVDSPFFVVDSVAPVIKVTYTSGGATVTPEGKDSSYYKDSVIVNLEIEDKHLLQEGIDAVITGTKADGTSVNIKVSEWNHSEGSDIWTATVELSDDGEYALSAKAVDRAENVSDTYTGAGFTIDRTIPVVTITFDNNSPQNEIYYNASRTATITVKDYTFDSSKSELSMNAPDNLPSEGDWNASGDQTYVKTVAFTKDGHYDFTFKTTDKAGNESEVVTIDLFIIDTTAPVVTVTYDNNDVKNVYYYKEARTATIKIDEKSFDEKSVVITAQASNDSTEMSALPSVAAFTGNAAKDAYTSKMSFVNDGKYGYTITVTDLAGNKSEVYTSDIFVIDTTVPDITFSGVENYSANNGVVAPVLIYKDLNIDASASVVTMTGANHGEVTPDSKRTETGDTVTITYSDFAHNKDTDDLYTLSVKITDMAGNVSEEELVFSVNRYGSVYVIGSETQELTQNYYTSEPIDVTITEINVDNLTYKEVSVDRDGDSEILREGKDYTVSVQGDDKSWKSMTYTVKADNFKKDGNYSVMVYSKDRATNTQDNRSAEKEIEFAVDGTKPSIVTSGIKEKGTYEEEGHDFIINVTDNMGVESLVVYTGQSELSELVSFTSEEIEDLGGTLTVNIPELDKYQNVMILATDVAGNQAELDYNNILVSRNAKEIIEDPNVPINDEIVPLIDPGPDPFKVWAAVAGGAVAVSGGVGAGVYLVRKKKINYSTIKKLFKK